MEKAEIPKEVCDVVLQKLHEDLRQKLNFHSIYPRLNARHLLFALDQSVLTSPITTVEKQVDIVISWLPKCGLQDYLTPFMKCLLESAEQAGDAHLELAEKIRLQCQMEGSHFLRLKRCIEDNEDEDIERDGPTDQKNLLNEAQTSVQHGSRKWWKPSRSLLLTCTAVTLTFTLTFVSLWFTTAMLMTRMIPPHERRLLWDGMHVRGNATVSLESSSVWLRSFNITFMNEDCNKTSSTLSDANTKVLFVPDVECTDLPTTNLTINTKEHPLGEPDLFYALPGSQVVINIFENTTEPNIWLTNYHLFKDWKLRNGYKNCTECSDICKPGKKSSTVTFNITKADFYMYTCMYKGEPFVPQNTLEWHYDFLVYDLQTIRENHPDVVDLSMYDSKSVLVEVAPIFHFRRKSCTLIKLLETSETGTKFSCIRITAKWRWEVTFLGSFVCLACAFLCTSVVLVAWYKRKHLVANNSPGN